AKATKARQAQSRLKMISRLKALEDGLDIDEDVGSIHFALKEPPRSGRVVMELKGLSIGYNGVPLSGGIDFIIERGQRIAVIGANGIGKTTLLKTVHGIIPPVEGSVAPGHEVKAAYFAQNQLDELSGESSVLESLLEASSDMGEREARSLLGSFLFRGADVEKKVKVLSGGEKGRVALARLLSMEANFIILDEPTNHLDMSSVEVLISALGEFQGTMLFVSHNRDFINSIATHVFVMLPDGRSMLFEGRLDDYETAAQLRGFPNVLAPSPERGLSPETRSKSLDSEEVFSKQESAPCGRDAVRDLRREKNRLEKETERLEGEQAALRERIGEIRDELSMTDMADYKRLSSLNTELGDAGRRLLSAEEAWLAASERLEAISDELKSLGRK
ncbi:MAG: ATP-binding cassette domain-containing protein, partial [Oligoflexales bacterium]|nr:ATP-binding cassette domain-containing protein [Oligoflexales bacterium]